MENVITGTGSNPTAQHPNWGALTGWATSTLHAQDWTNWEHEEAPASTKFATKFAIKFREILTISFAAIAIVAHAGQARALLDVGEIVSRPTPMASSDAMSALQNARSTVQKRLANIAGQAEPLSDAVAAYKASGAETLIFCPTNNELDEVAALHKALGGTTEF